MSREDFQRLRTAVLADERLQERLRAASTHGEGAFQVSLAEEAAARGLQLDAGDVSAALLDARRAWAERWLS